MTLTPLQSWLAFIATAAILLNVLGVFAHLQSRGDQ